MDLVTWIADGGSQACQLMYLRRKIESHRYCHWDIIGQHLTQLLTGEE